MIIKTFDHGWGLRWPIKQIEQEVLDRYLAPLQQSDQKVVVINSTWYGQEQHQLTLDWLRNNDWDSIALVAMLDPAIPAGHWFNEFQKPVYEIGGYNNQYYIALWAEIVDRYITPYRDHDIDIPFMCLNRKPHWHRVRFYEQLKHQGLLDRGLVSMGGKADESAVRELAEHVSENDLAPAGLKKYHGIPNDVASLGDTNNWRRHFLNVVTETVYDINRYSFVSEKIFKPILGCRPFLVYDDDGAHRWLTTHGFESYINDFRDISSLDLSISHNLAPFLKILCDQSQTYWREKYIDLLPKISYNLERFKSFVQEQRHRIEKGIPCPI